MVSTPLHCMCCENMHRKWEKNISQKLMKKREAEKGLAIRLLVNRVQKIHSGFQGSPARLFQAVPVTNIKLWTSTRIRLWHWNDFKLKWTIDESSRTSRNNPKKTRFSDVFACSRPQTKALYENIMQPQHHSHFDFRHSRPIWWATRVANSQR